MSKQHEKAISVLDRLEMIAAQGAAMKLHAIMISPELVREIVETLKGFVRSSLPACSDSSLSESEISKSGFDVVVELMRELQSARAHCKHLENILINQMGGMESRPPNEIIECVERVRESMQREWDRMAVEILDGTKSNK